VSKGGRKGGEKSEGDGLFGDVENTGDALFGVGFPGGGEGDGDVLLEMAEDGRNRGERFGRGRGQVSVVLGGDVSAGRMRQVSESAV
jgi:hypothetical protein